MLWSLFAYNQAQKIEKVNGYGKAASASSFSEGVRLSRNVIRLSLLVHYNLSTTEPAHPRCGLPVDDDDRWFPPQAFRLPPILPRHSSPSFFQTRSTCGWDSSALRGVTLF